MLYVSSAYMAITEPGHRSLVTSFRKRIKRVGPRAKI
jgi:hypothetical protein